MENEDIYPTPKRRRTSSRDSISSTESKSERHGLNLPIGHGRAGRAREETQDRRYSSSRSRAGSAGSTSRRDPGRKATDLRSIKSRSRSQTRRSRRSSSESDSDNTPPPDYSRFQHTSKSSSYSPRSADERNEIEHEVSRSDSPLNGKPRLQQDIASKKTETSKSKLKTNPKSLTFRCLTNISRAHGRGITTVKFSPDGTLLATGSADAAIHIYSVPSDLKNTTGPNGGFKLLRTLNAHLAGINAIAWSPIGPPYTLASASDDKSILLWSPLASDFPISPSPLTGHSNYVYSLAFSPKGNMLVTGSYDEAIFLWDVRSARVMRSLPAHSDPVGGVDFLRDGSMVASCAGDGLIRLWDSGTGQCLRTLVDEDRKPVTSVRFSPNGKYILAWTLDNSIRLWRYIEGTCVKTYLGHTNRQFSLSGAFGSYVIQNPNTGGDDGNNDDNAMGNIRHKEEAFVVSGSEDGDLLVWNVISKEVLWRAKRAHEDVVLAVDCISHRKNRDYQEEEEEEIPRAMLASVGKDRDIKIWIEDREDNSFSDRGNNLDGNVRDEEILDDNNGQVEGIKVDGIDQEDVDMSNV